MKLSSSERAAGPSVRHLVLQTASWGGSSRIDGYQSECFTWMTSWASRSSELLTATNQKRGFGGCLRPQRSTHRSLGCTPRYFHRIQYSSILCQPALSWPSPVSVVPRESLEYCFSHCMSGYDFVTVPARAQSKGARNGLIPGQDH